MAGIAVLGTGTMGTPIARNLLRAGFDVRVWNRSRARTDALVADGARYAPTPSAAAEGVDVLITMLADGAAVEQVMTGQAGALPTLSPGAVWIQMSTVGVEWTDRLATSAARRGVTFVDAPVSGSSEPAEKGELVVLASGALSVRSRVEPIFDVLGRQTLWLERIGDGSRLKLVLNNWLAVLVEGMAETLALSATLDLDPHLFVGTIAGGPLGSPYAVAKADAMLDARFRPGFPLRHADKDATLASHAAQDRGLALPLTTALLGRWQDAIALGHGDDDVASAVTASWAGATGDTSVTDRPAIPSR
jgi:3-hydroxyisobutyrate dehydrogenase